jgi:hypothetical protein
MKKEKIVHKLLLDTKAKIPFLPAQLIFYQPNITEIALFGESIFFVAVTSLTKDYRKLIVKDNSNLDNLTNFDVIMSIIREKTENSKFIFRSIFQLFELILPDYKVRVTPSSFLFIDKNVTEGEQPQTHIIDNKNFDDFTQVIFEMFALDAFSGDITRDYNPAGDRARALVEKFKKKHELLAQLKKERGEDTAVASVFGRYINILAVGMKKDKNQLAKYSVYQLIEEFNRFELKEAFDYTLQAKMAGAKNVKDAKDWMQDISFGVDSKE